MSIVQGRRGADYLVEDTDPEDVLTPEDMDEEQRMMMAAIRDFADKEVEPVMDELEKRNWDVALPLFRKAADLGIFMAEVPESYGGLGMSVLGIAGMMESRSYLGALSSTVFAHQGIGCLPLINFGTQAQIDKYLASLMDGTRIACFALTEPSSGSDAMNIKTTASLNEEGTHYVVNGSKQFITNAGIADLFILFAKVEGTQFTAFLLDRKSDGLEVGPNENLLGIRGSSVCPIMLSDVKIPVENVLGEVGKGHKVALCTLNLGRLKMATNCVGGGKRILKCATDYTSERMQFGVTLATFGLIQRKIADMASRLYATQSLAYRTAGLVYNAVEDMGEEARESIDARLAVLTEFSIECALAKVHGTEMVNFLADETLQCHGGYGYSEEYAPAKYFRDWRIARIYEGTSEICRLTAMKAVLKKSARGELALGPAIVALDPPDQPDGSVGMGQSLEDLRKQVVALKNVFLYLAGEILEAHGSEGVLDNENEQFLASLADVALEIYAVESTILRVLKIQSHHPDADTKLPEALARLYFERAAQRIQEEAVEILSALHHDEALRACLKTVNAWIPLPSGRIGLREYVSNAIVEAGGALPEYRN